MEKMMMIYRDKSYSLSLYISIFLSLCISLIDEICRLDENNSFEERYIYILFICVECNVGGV